MASVGPRAVVSCLSTAQKCPCGAQGQILHPKFRPAILQGHNFGVKTRQFLQKTPRKVRILKSSTKLINHPKGQQQKGEAK